MRRAGVPVTPGSDGPVDTVEQALAAAERVGYPVLLKACAGGGGRGIRRCDSPEELPAAFQAAKAEARACFGDDEMYLEKLILRPRHIEFQILADRQGNVIHLGDRDCSIQRRNQKLIEEAPAWCLTPELRAEMGEAAVRAARAVGYEGAGTVEFLLDGDLEHFYFMEMNTRIQVEHRVTELVTGVDLVRQQLRIASGPAPGPDPGGGLPPAATPSSAASTPRTRPGLPALPGQGGVPPLPRRERGAGGLLPVYRL